MIVLIDESKLFGADPLFFDYVVRELEDNSRVHVVSASKLR